MISARTFIGAGRRGGSIRRGRRRYERASSRRAAPAPGRCAEDDPPMSTEPAQLTQALPLRFPGVYLPGRGRVRRSASLSISLFSRSLSLRSSSANGFISFSFVGKQRGDESLDRIGAGPYTALAASRKDRLAPRHIHGRAASDQPVEPGRFPAPGRRTPRRPRPAIPARLPARVVGLSSCRLVDRVVREVDRPLGCLDLLSQPEPGGEPGGLADGAGSPHGAGCGFPP